MTTRRRELPLPSKTIPKGSWTKMEGKGSKHKLPYDEGGKILEWRKMGRSHSWVRSKLISKSIYFTRFGFYFVEGIFWIVMRRLWRVEKPNAWFPIALYLRFRVPVCGLVRIAHPIKRDVEWLGFDLSSVAVVGAAFPYLLWTGCRSHSRFLAVKCAPSN